MKSLEVSEQNANHRVEEFKVEMESLTDRLKQVETRAENAEKLVKRLQKVVDNLEGMHIFLLQFYKYFFDDGCVQISHLVQKLVSSRFLFLNRF